MINTHFNDLVDCIDSIADQWPTANTVVSEQENESLRYASVCDIIFDGVSTQLPDLPEKLQNKNVRHSTKVMLRYCQIAAIIASESGMNSPELNSVMLDDRSFGQLGLIASQQLRVASRTETDFEMRTYQNAPTAGGISKYSIVDGAIVLKDLNGAIIRNYINVASENHAIYKGECAAHQNNALKPIYRSLVAICARDDNLFPLTLAK